jgi:hypothetical protein
VRRRRPARFASSAISRAERLTPASFLLERLAGGGFGVLAGRLGAFSSERHIPSRRAAPLAAAPRPCAARAGAGQLDVAGGEAAAAATSSGVALAAPLDRLDGSGAKSTGWQREATVSSSAAGSELSRIRWTNSGGSSSVFSSAFWLSSRIASAASIDEDALAALEGPVGGGADHPLAHLLDHVLGAAGSARRGRGGARGRAAPAAARPRDPAARARISAAKARAAARLPAPAGPRKR